MSNIAAPSPAAERVRAEQAVIEVATLQEDNNALRRLLWEHHGHEGIYGDDDEMQCSSCGLDFKRDTVERLVDAFAHPNNWYGPLGPKP